MTSVTSVKNPKGSLNIRYISFLPYCFPVLYVIEWYVEADIYLNLQWIIHTSSHSVQHGVA
jgi:hypothetical protein